MKFTHFIVHIYKEEDLAKLSGLLFNQILGTDFDKPEVINGFTELTTYLCANELKYLKTNNSSDTFDKKTISDTLIKYFPEKRKKYSNIPTTDSQIHDALRKKKEELEYIFNSYSYRDPISFFSTGKKLRKSWKPAADACLEVFNKMVVEIKNRPHYLFDEQPNAIQHTEEDFNNDGEPINSKSTSVNRIKNANNDNNNNNSQTPTSNIASPNFENGTDNVSNNNNNNKPEESTTITSSSASSRYITENESSQRNRLDTPSPRKRRKFWTAQETKALEDGLYKFKGPFWTQIKNAYPVELVDRDGGQLKDKARNMINYLETCNKDLGPYKYVKIDN
ncbi:hypothetical protein BJ944DRAFT_75949 [Cunninghamella echinulata]|nr:hypothetical protein BJ944DRAFT_75949 [Cunninghamella echinulata]